MGDFAAKTKIELKSGDTIVIKEKIGEGGQGKVYKVDLNGKTYALKWYHKDAFGDKKRNFYANLENNISNGAPTDAFLWPLGITKVYDESFGYIMALRPAGYEELTSFFVGTKTKKQIHFSSFSAQINAAINIIEGFRELHNRGYSYQDINNGNFFIEPSTGNVLICDNDNVSPFGNNLGIQGKQRWMAPEIVLMKNDPDKLSDRFSLAVVLFRLLFINHPLEGKYSTPPCMTKALEQKYYGTDPVFIYDPTNKINEPIPGTDMNLKKFWNVYPQYVRDAFIRAFSYELMVTTKQKRITEIEWLKLFYRLRTELCACPYCKKETFYSVSGTTKCLECGKTFTNKLYMKTPYFTIPLVPGKKITTWHIDTSLPCLNDVIAEVVTNPNNPTMIGIKNISGKTWNVKKDDGQIKPVIPQQSFPARDKFEIDSEGKGQFNAVIYSI